MNMHITLNSLFEVNETAQRAATDCAHNGSCDKKSQKKLITKRRYSEGDSQFKGRIELQVRSVVIAIASS